MSEELVKLAQSGDTTALAELVKRYQRASILTAYAVLGDFHASQDAAQEAFIIAWQKLDGLRNPASFGPWLLRIVRRRALRLLRQRKPGATQIEVIDLPEKQPLDWLGKYRDVVEQIARLPEHERLIMVMRYVDGQSVKDIASFTDRPIGTVTKQLSRAIQRLRDRNQVK